MARRWRLPYAALKHDSRSPVVDIEIHGPSGLRLGVRALIDSGADTTTFPIDMMGALGLKKLDCHKVKSATAAGTADCYVCKRLIDAEFDGEKFKLQANFMPGLPIPLLGRQDFFAHFKVSFNEQAEVVTLETYS